MENPDIGALFVSSGFHGPCVAMDHHEKGDHGMLAMLQLPLLRLIAVLVSCDIWDCGSLFLPKMMLFCLPLYIALMFSCSSRTLAFLTSSLVRDTEFLMREAQKTSFLSHQTSNP